MRCRWGVRIVSAWVLAALGASAQAPSAPYAFGAWETVGGTIPAMVVADVQGSPLPDLIFVATDLSLVRIGQSAAAGTVHTYSSLSVAANPSDVAVGDLDGDGDRDIVTINAAQASVLLNGAASFVRSDYGLLNGNAERVQLADLDGDGDLDLIRGSVMRANDGAGGFPLADGVLVSNGGAPLDALVGDIDGDGDLDLLGRTTTASTVAFADYPNLGGGVFAATAGFSATLFYPGIGYAPKAVMADVDADGRSDLVLHRYSVTATSELTVWRGQANGALLSGPGTGPYYGWVNWIGAPVVADCDGDGDLDVASGISSTITDHPSATSWLWRNDGAGQLYSPINLPLGIYADRGTSVVDLDLDGDPDFVNAMIGLGYATGYVQCAFNVGLGAGPASVALSALSGGGQSAVMGQPFAAPLILQLTDGAGAPIVGMAVSVAVASGAGTVSAGGIGAGSQTSMNGMIGFTVTAGQTTGPLVVVAAVANAAPVVMTLNVTPYVLAVVSGDLQSTPNGTAFPQPLVVSLTDLAGAPVANTALTFSTTAALSLVGGAGSATQRTVVTDSAGLASVIAAAAPLGPNAPVAVTVTAPSSAVAPVTFTLTPSGTTTVSVDSGDAQGLDFGDAPDPIVFRVSDAVGAPVANATLNVSVSPTAAAANAIVTTLVTDFQGRATFSPVWTGAAQGLIGVAATAVPPTNTAIAHIFVRKLSVNHVAGASSATLIYRHDHGPQPLVFAIDTPLPFPGFVPTPYGTIATSILASPSTAVVFDTLGGLGHTDVSLVADPTLVTVRLVPPSLFGQTVVLQIYGFDPLYLPDLTKAVFVSNAVTVTL